MKAAQAPAVTGQLVLAALPFQPDDLDERAAAAPNRCSASSTSLRNMTSRLWSKMSSCTAKRWGDELRVMGHPKRYRTGGVAGGLCAVLPCS
jgi:hypothetical protein